MTKKENTHDMNEIILGGAEIEPLDLDNRIENYKNNPTIANLVRVAHLALEAGVVNLAKSVEYSTSVGDNLSSLLFNRLKQVRELSIDLVRKQGKGATEPTAGILAAMQAGCDVETAVGNILVTSLLAAQHSMEVFVDDPHLADFSLPDRVKLYKFLINKEKEVVLNEDSEYLLTDGEIYDYDSSLRKYRYIIANEVDKMIKGKLGVFTGLTAALGIRLDAFGDETKLSKKQVAKLVKLEDVFQMHFNSLKNLNLYVNTLKTAKTEKIGNFMLQASANRYIGVEEEIKRGGHANFADNEEDLDVALTLREYSIMIELTAGGLAFSMANQKENIADYLNSDTGFETFTTLIRLATRLVGLSNDCGSYLLRSTPDKIEEFFEAIKASSPDSLNLREAIAPEDFRKKANADKNLATSDLVSLRAEYDLRHLNEENSTEKEYNSKFIERENFWRNYLQLLKDATKGEGNLLLDFGLNQFNSEVETERSEGNLNATVLDKQLVLAKKIVRMSQDMELRIGQTISNDKEMPEELSTMGINMVTYHYNVYGPTGGDYYGKDNIKVVAELKTIKGEKDPADWRLYGETREN